MLMNLVELEKDSRLKKSSKVQSEKEPRGSISSVIVPELLKIVEYYVF